MTRGKGHKVTNVSVIAPVSDVKEGISLIITIFNDTFSLFNYCIMNNNHLVESNSVQFLVNVPFCVR